MSHSFQVEVIDGHKKRKFVLITTSIEDRDSWLDAFAEAIESQKTREAEEKMRRTKSFHSTARPVDSDDEEEDETDQIEEIQIKPKMIEPKKRSDSTPMSQSTNDVSQLARPVLTRKMHSQDLVQRADWRRSVKPTNNVVVQEDVNNNTDS